MEGLMNKNVGSGDRLVRVVVGVAILSLIWLLHGNVRWLGLIGIVPLLTAAMGFCPLYLPFGIRTCSK